MHWIKVKDKLPEPGKEVLVGFWARMYDEEKDCIDFVFLKSVALLISEKDGWSECLGGNGDENITHWCPIPEDPCAD